jgi:acetyltransferase-like isoleucine patch superfamily enzyme
MKTKKVGIIMKFIKLVRKLFSALKRKYEISKYNPYTISEYFRKQGAQIGNDCYLSISYLAGEPYLVKLGNHVGIAAGVQFLTHNLGWVYRDKIPDLQLFGKIIVEDNCNIGINAMILPNVTIGRNSIIAAGSIVTKDIPPNSIAVGVPAKIIGNTYENFEKVKLIWAEQKPEGYMKELILGNHYSAAYFDSLRSRPEYKKLLRKHLTKLFWGEER